jgi:hypothetical protein
MRSLHGARSVHGRKFSGPARTFANICSPVQKRTHRITYHRYTVTSVADLAAFPPQDEKSQQSDVDERLQGFPAPLDQEIARMAIPSLASVIMDPLLGAVDTGALTCLNQCRTFAIIKCISCIVTNISP